MGIINITRDSFYSSSRVANAAVAVERAAEMIRDGADILDLGAESTRPGSQAVSLRHELDFLIPAVDAIHKEFPNVPISVDTRKAQVANEAISAGASIINDVSGLGLPEEAPALLELLRRSDVYYVLMHTKGTPVVMNAAAVYADFWGELTAFFNDKLALLEGAGVARERIILDPGIGFAKQNIHNLNILANLSRFEPFALPLLIGVSRKGFIGKALGEAPPEDRLESTLAITALCTWQRVDIVRVHDVLQNRRAINMIGAIRDVQPL